MWRLMVIDSLNQRRTSVDYTSWTMRTVFCIIIMLLLVITLAFAAEYHQLNNFGIGVLLFITITFVLYSIAVKMEFISRGIDLAPFGADNQIWTIKNIDYSANYHDLMKNPPSYETVINDRNRIRSTTKELPSYETAIKNHYEQFNSISDLNKNCEKNRYLILDVTKLNTISETRSKFLK